MTKRNDGGPAFPLAIEMEGPNGSTLTYIGISARDYFAAKAMQGVVSGDEEPQGGFNTDTIAQWAYSMADAMLAERGN